MAVEKMRFVNIAGRISDMDDFIIKTIVPFDVQLEPAMSILDSIKGVRPFTEVNPYERLNEKIAELIRVLDQPMHYDNTKSCMLMPVELLEPEIDGYERQLETIQRISRSLKADLAHKKEIRRQVIPIQNLDVQVDKLFHFTFMKFRFGKMPKDSYDKLQGYLDELDTIVFKVSEEDANVYVIYFTPRSEKGNIDSFFASLFFERIWISDDVHGTPKDALVRLNDEIKELQERIEMLDNDSKEFIGRHYDRLQELYNYTIELNEVFDVRRYAARTEEAFFITGWIPDSQVSAFKAMVDKMERISCVIEDDDSVKKAKPPTHLKNTAFFRPFEELVRMYGTPSYEEMDPTPFVGITYLIFFGIMFGDVGQGLVIALAGYYLYRFKGVVLGKLAVYLGFMSTISGVFYGSVFGNEEWIPKYLPFIPTLNPMEYKLPLLGATVGLGVLLILVAMVINIVNHYRQDQPVKIYFDKNGFTGLVLYLALIYIAITVLLQIQLSPWVIVFFVICPIIVMFMAHPLELLMEHREHIFPSDKGSFFIETFFEMLETLLGILSNTISFMRVGAFALNHVGFFMAFHALSDIVGGAGSVLVMIFGNLLIIVLEGLIVAIQGLRLEYYELFSRFFEGEGQEFKPFKIKG